MATQGNGSTISIEGKLVHIFSSTAWAEYRQAQSSTGILVEFQSLIPHVWAHDVGTEGKLQRLEAAPARPHTLQTLTQQGGREQRARKLIIRGCTK